MGSFFGSIGDALKSGWNAVKPYVPIAVGAAATQAVANQQPQYPAGYPATAPAPSSSQWSPLVLIGAAIAGVLVLVALMRK